jgi:hypothetical protein
VGFRHFVPGKIQLQRLHHFKINLVGHTAAKTQNGCIGVPLKNAMKELWIHLQHRLIYEMKVVSFIQTAARLRHRNRLVVVVSGRTE